MITLTHAQALELERLANLKTGASIVPIRPDGWIDIRQYAEGKNISQSRSKTILRRLAEKGVVESLICYDPQRRINLSVYKIKDQDQESS